MSSGRSFRSCERMGEDPARVRIGTLEKLIGWLVLHLS